MINPKCKACRKELEPNKAYKKLIDGKNAYFCSKQEYDAWLIKTEHDKEIFRKICVVVKRIYKYTSDVAQKTLSKTIYNIGENYPLEVVLKYLEDNEESIKKSMSKKTFDLEYGGIKYLVAIISNNIEDYYILYYDEDDVVEAQDVVFVDYEMPEVKYKPKTIRRPMKDIERLGDCDG